MNKNILFFRRQITDVGHHASKYYNSCNQVIKKVERYPAQSNSADHIGYKAYKQGIAQSGSPPIGFGMPVFLHPVKGEHTRSDLASFGQPDTITPQEYPHKGWNSDYSEF